MSDARKKILGRVFKEAGSTGKKTHVIARSGKWAIFKEGSNKIFAEYSTRPIAIKNAKKFLTSGQSDMVVLHKADGSVEKVQLAK